MSLYMSTGLPNDDFRRQAENHFLKEKANAFNGGQILEIGSWKGGSTKALCETSNRVTSVDPWESDEVFQEFQNTTRAFNNLITFRGTSKDFFKSNTERFDLIFIDGDHSRNWFFHDLMMSLNSIKPGGTIVCHDFDMNHPWIVTSMQRIGHFLFSPPVSCFYTVAVEHINTALLMASHRDELARIIKYAGTSSLIRNPGLLEYRNRLNAETLSAEMIQYVKEMIDSSTFFAPK